VTTPTQPPAGTESYLIVDLFSEFRCALSLSQLVSLERWSSSEYHLHRNQIIILILGGLIFVLLFSLIALSLPGLEEPFDGDDDPLVHLGQIGGMITQPLPVLLLLGFELGILTEIFRLEYFRAHIGEKRLPALPLQANHSSWQRWFPATALWHCRAVFSCYVHALRSKQPCLRPRSTHSISL
jgi:hypothetical protein